AGPRCPARLCAIGLVLPTGVAAHDPELTPLALRQSVEKPIARGQEHRFTVALAAGDYAAARIVQKGIDVFATVSDPAGRVIDQVQDELRPDGEERIEIAASAGGTYLVTARTPNAAFGPGSYVIQLDSVREATDADRALQDARTLRTRARALDETGGYQKARPIFEQAIAAAEGVRGPDDVFVAVTVFDFAGNALER